MPCRKPSSLPQDHDLAQREGLSPLRSRCVPGTRWGEPRGQPVLSMLPGEGPRMQGRVGRCPRTEPNTDTALLHKHIKATADGSVADTRAVQYRRVCRLRLPLTVYKKTHAKPRVKHTKMLVTLPASAGVTSQWMWLYISKRTDKGLKETERRTGKQDLWPPPNQELKHFQAPTFKPTSKRAERRRFLTHG